jgi:hypothetical protein
MSDEMHGRLADPLQSLAAELLDSAWQAAVVLTTVCLGGLAALLFRLLGCDPHKEALRKGMVRARRAAGLTHEQAAALLHCSAAEVLRWELSGSPPVGAYELLVLKTGQFSFDRMLLSNPACVDLRLPDGHPVRIHLPTRLLMSMARVWATEVRDCSHCGNRFIGHDCPSCHPPRHP